MYMYTYNQNCTPLGRRCVAPSVVCSLHDIVLTNLVWCTYKREVGRGIVYCPIIVQSYCSRVGNAGRRREWKDGWFVLYSLEVNEYLVKANPWLGSASDDLAFIRFSFTLRLLRTNQSSLYCVPPPGLPTLLQYYCTTIAQYTTFPPRPP